MSSDDDDIRDVMEEEKSRGVKQPTRSKARRSHAKMVTESREMLQLDWKRFLEALSALDVKPGSKKYEQAVRAWNERHGPWKARD